MWHRRLARGWSCASFRIGRDPEHRLSHGAGPRSTRASGCTAIPAAGRMTTYLMASTPDRRGGAVVLRHDPRAALRDDRTAGRGAEHHGPGGLRDGADGLRDDAGAEPTLMCTATQDFSTSRAAGRRSREAKQIYGMLATRSGWTDRIQRQARLLEAAAEASMRWMRRWLMGVDDAPVEGEFPVFQGGGAALHAVGPGARGPQGKVGVRPGYRARQRAGDEASGAGAGSAEGRQSRRRSACACRSPGSAWSPAGGRSSRNRNPVALCSPNAFPKRVPPPGTQDLVIRPEGKSASATPGHITLSLDLRGYGDSPRRQVALRLRWHSRWLPPAHLTRWPSRDR